MKFSGCLGLGGTYVYPLKVLPVVLVLVLGVVVVLVLLFVVEGLLVAVVVVAAAAVVVVVVTVVVTILRLAIAQAPVALFLSVTIPKKAQKSMKNWSRRRRERGKEGERRRE